MDFFKKLFREKSEYEKNQEEISKQKKEFLETLKKSGLSRKERQEIKSIINLTEIKIQKIKESMKGKNINNPNAIEDTENAVNQIRVLQENMQNKIKTKIQEIKDKKSDL